MAIAAMSIHAQTLIDYPASTDGIYLYSNSGTAATTDVDYSTVKIHENKDAVDCIKIGKSYKFGENGAEGYYASLYVDGGFKKGDVIKIAGVFNNADDTKKAAVAFRLDPTSEEPTWTTEPFINGRTSAGEPVEQTYTLEEDTYEIFFGRSGNTGTCITSLKVIRGDETPSQDDDKPLSYDIFSYPASTDGLTISGTITTNSVKLKKNTDSRNAIEFPNGYMTEDALNGNYAIISTEGGFKKGDIIAIAGAFNNTDETKKAAIDIFSLEGGKPKVHFTTRQFINGRLVDDDPVVEYFTLEEDAENLYLGRNGNTKTCVTMLTVSRFPETSIIGAEDNTTELGKAASVRYTIPADGALHLEFVNNTTDNSGVTDFDEIMNRRLNNFIVVIDDMNENTFENALYAVLYASKDGLNRCIYKDEFTAEDNWQHDYFADDYISKIINGAKVKLDITRQNADVTVNANIETTNGKSYYVKYSFSTSLLASKLNIATYLTVKNCHLVIDNTKTVRTNPAPPTGIAAITADTTQNGAIYNLAGQKVDAQYKGMVIAGGKKLLRK